MAEKGEGGEGESEPEEAIPTNDLATQLALMEADKGRAPKALKEEATAFLKDQRQLIHHQLHHLTEQFRHLKLKIWGERLRLSLQVLSLIFVATVVLMFGRVVYEAVNDHSLTIQGFSSAPTLEAKGFGGKVLAEGLMHRVNAIRETADRLSFDHSDDVHAQEDSALKVEIPGSGVSLEEVETFIHRTIGHQVPVSGDLREGDDGKASLTLYFGASDPIVIEGTADDIDALMQKGAEAVFQRFDPNNYVVYLASLPHRHAEAIKAAQYYIDVARADQHSDSYALYGDTLIDKSRAMAYARLATDVDPKIIYGWYERVQDAYILSHEEEVLQSGRRLVNVRKEDQPERLRRGRGVDWLIEYGRQRIALETGDYAALAQANTISDRGAIAAGALSEATSRAYLHDEAGARRAYARAELAGGADPGYLATVSMLIAVNGQHWADARTEAEKLMAYAQAWMANGETDDERAGAALWLNRTVIPWHAWASAETGDTDAAWAEISATPLDCDLCLRTRGIVASLRGDADYGHWFELGAQHAPDIPVTYYYWGQALLAHGDKKGAAAKFKLAIEKGPAWEDPKRALAALEPPGQNRAQ